MTSRERVRAALALEPTDRIPKDLGGMRSTGISCFAYPDLVRVLGLPPRKPRVHDTGQMLALPDIDVLDALDIDVVTVETAECTSAFDEPDRWTDFDFNGRLPTRLKEVDGYGVESDGTMVDSSGRRMPPSSYVFDDPHGGQELDLDIDLKLRPLDQVADRVSAGLLSQERIETIASYVRRVRQTTDRAIFFAGPTAGLGYPRGLATWSMVCLTEPDYVAEYHRIVTDGAVENMRRLLPRIAEDIDLIMTNADDQGLQDRTILRPATFRELYVPYYQRVNDAIHESAPGVKSFLHSCGAIYDIIDDVIDAGFDVLNPVQWSAGGRSFKEWKDKARGRIALWGGGVNTQVTLPFGTVDDVRREAREVAEYLSQDSGFVFCAIHNILAEIPGQKVLAMYESV